MRYRIILIPEASKNIWDICAYIEQNSPQNASLVAQRIFKDIDSLELQPRRYEVHQRRRDPAKTVHSMAVPPFIVYYRVDDPQRVVIILSVLHGARRQPRRFS